MGLFPVRLFNKVILGKKTSDQINPIFRGFLLVSAKRDRQPSAKMCPVGRHFWWQWGRAERWDFFPEGDDALWLVILQVQPKMDIVHKGQMIWDELVVDHGEVDRLWLRAQCRGAGEQARRG